MSQFLTLKNGVPYLQSVVGLGSPYDQYITYGSAQAGPFDVTLPAGQTYNVGQNELLVFENGVALVLGLDYTEKNTTTITINRDLTAGTTLRIRR